MPSSPEQLIPEADKASATSTWLRPFMMIGLTILIWVAWLGYFSGFSELLRHQFFYSSSRRFWPTFFTHSSSY